MPSLSFAKSEFTNIDAVYFIPFGLDAHLYAYAYLITMAIDPCFRLREYFSPDTVINLHGHCEPENCIF